MADSKNKLVPNIQNKESGLNIDPKKLINDLLRFWWLFLITIPFCYGVVEVVHRYSIPVYGASMTVIVDERGENDSKASMMEGFGLTPGMRNVDNQIAVLSSWDMLRNTVDQLDFYVSYFVEGRLKKTELYGNLDFRVVFDSTHVQLLNVPMYVRPVDENSFLLTIECEQGALFDYAQKRMAGSVGAIKYSQVHRYNELVIMPWMAVSIQRKAAIGGKELFFTFNHPESVVAQYKSALRVNKTNENSSIIGLYITGTNNEKNIAFLNKLGIVLIETNLKQKNKIADNTITFIESQLVNISDSLRLVGTELSDFRTSNKIQSVSSKGDYLFSELQRIENEINRMKVQVNYYRYLVDYFSSDSIPDGLIAPAMLDTQSGVLAQQIGQLIEINSEKMTLGDTYGQPNHPMLAELNSKYQIAKNVLIQSINNHLALVKDDMRILEGKKMATENELYALPETERKMLGIERKFELNNEVYTFLLRKRSESQIQKASNTSDHKVLESARYAGQVSPNTQGNRKKALMLGVLLPLVFIVLRQLLNRRIQGVEDINKLTSLPVLGQIVHSKKAEPDVVIKHPKSVIAETFRRVRTRLEFLTGEITCPIISVTSSMPGEGKTFCALNIASVYAISGKKTILLGFDLRRPGLNKILDLHQQCGISNYLIGQCTLNDIVKNSLHENLFVVQSGDIPPNPSELISSEKTKLFLAELRKQYDIIIIDTPPMGIVSDPYLLARQSDVLIFLARDNYSIRDVFHQSMQAITDEGLEHVGILLNDQHVQQGRYAYRYGNYHYHYGSQTGYYED